MRLVRIRIARDKRKKEALSASIGLPKELGEALSEADFRFHPGEAIDSDSGIVDSEGNPVNGILFRLAEKETPLSIVLPEGWGE